LQEEMKADFCLLVREYPANMAELQELADEGLVQAGIVDVWAQIYMAGESLGSEEVLGGVQEAPELLHMAYEAINSAALGSELADLTVCTVTDSHELAFAPLGSETPTGDRVQRAILDVLKTEAEARARYGKWLKGAERVTIKSEDVLAAPCETRLYERLMASVDASHHDVPLFLHCLTEQVGLLLAGEAQQLEDQVAVCGLEEYLSSAHDGMIAGGSGSAPQPAPGAAQARSRPGSSHGRGNTAATDATGQFAIPTPATLLPFLDRSSCSHHLGGGGGSAARLAAVSAETSGGDPAIDVARRILEQLSAPGARRSKLPPYALHSAGQREFLASRFYPFAPQVSPAELEQLLLLHGFEELLRKAQPERTPYVGDRVYRERIPKELLAQTLSAAFQDEFFMDTSYLPRYDCLLVALHYRTLKGRTMWHSWRGDLLQPHDSDRWADGLFPIPTYNDWATVFRGRFMDVPQPRMLLEGYDGRQGGYQGIIEKLATPADGSIILITKLESGLTHSFPPPSNEQPNAEMPNHVTAFEAQSYAQSEKAQSVVHGDAPATEAGQPPVQRFSPAPRSMSHLAQVIKDGLTFGIFSDDTWSEWQRAEQERATVALAADKAAAGVVDDPDASDPAEVTPVSLPFDGSKLGSLWVALPGGARCTVRMHHELAFADATKLPEELPTLGAMLTYTMAAGQVIQVFSDGAVRCSWPLQLRHDSGSAPAAAHGKPNTVGGQSWFKPGCPDDAERSRTVTPHGTLIRKLLSGRFEIYHADGTTATRNPTAEEVETQLQRMAGISPQRIEFLQRLHRSLVDDQKKISLTEPPTSEAKALGLPGHWIVVQTQLDRDRRQRMFGRVSAPRPEASQTDTVTDPSSDGAPAVDTPTQQLPSLQELLGGYLVDDGSIIEYEITKDSVALQVDLQTQHKTLTNGSGLASFEDPDSVQRLCVHMDGTQVTRTMRDGGYDVAISKEPHACIKCEINDCEHTPNMKVYVDCADGAHLEVVPQSVDRGQVRPLSPVEPKFASLSTNAFVSLKCRDGASLVSTGSGEVKVLTTQNDDGRSCYVAHCDADCLSLSDAIGGKYELHGDQTLSTVSLTAEVGDAGVLQSPRCLSSEHACAAPGTERLDTPAQGPPPRLFMIYGDGRAEEMLSADAAQALLSAAQDDPLAVLIGDQPLPAEGCVSHTIFRHRFPDIAAARPAFGIALPDGLDVAGSVYSMATGSQQQGSVQTVPGSSIQEYRQIIEYPSISEDTLTKFHGTLKQYRQWEAELILKIQKALAGPEAKGKKDAKKAKDKDKDKDKKAKDKKGKKKKGAVDEEEVEEVVLPPIPKFIMDLNLSIFDHEVQALEFRSKQLPQPSDDELLKLALEVRDKKEQETVEADADAKFPVSNLPGGGRLSDRGLDSEIPGIDDSGAERLNVEGWVEGDPEAANDGDRTVMPEASPPKPPKEKKARPRIVDEEPTFSFFSSEMGIQFLQETGQLDPDRMQPARKAKPDRTSRRPPPVPRRGPWNPRLVGEADPEEEQQQTGPSQLDMDSLQEQQAAEEAEARRGRAGQDNGEGMGGYAPPDGRGYPSGSNQGQGMPFAPPRPPFPIVPESQENPYGPHPDKRSAEWDVYGEKRPEKMAVSQAYVGIHQDYLEVEGPTDRRVRTMSISQKKNSAKAPSVSSVRKTGVHAIGRSGEISAKDILGEGIGVVDEHWKLSSTMQGLGSSNNLVDVRPGACRFGPLRRGSLYRMAFYLRNLDVDVTRFNIARLDPPSKYVRVDYQPGHLAPGIAARIVVEIAALDPKKIEQLIEVRLKAHVIRVPVIARIFDAEEYDRLDAESMALHGRRIGRHRERTEANKPGPVELVTDRMYCEKMLGDKYLAPPPDFEEVLPQSPGNALR
jgi:hypothetical protein